MAESTYTLFDLCAGTGMLGVAVKIALETLGIRADTVGGCEREASATAAFLAGLENTQGGSVPVWDDATTLFGRRCRGLERVDAITAGYPCQPFSHAGKRDGAKDARHLWPAIRRCVARLEPELVFFENVDGHVSLGLWKVLRDIERLGYRVTTGVFSAEEVGAPHLRKRVFILGLADGEHPRWSRSSVHAGRWKEGCGEAELGGGSTMGDTESVVKRERQRFGTASKRWPEPRLEGPSEALGDTNGPRLESGRPADTTGHSGIDRGSRGIFPPGRTDYDRWADLATGGLAPSLYPAIESGVPVVADGNLASSSDLLRLGGNAVCPLQAAWAFINLTACLLEPMGSRTERQTNFFD